jgi:hypothetical protein
MTTQTNLKAGRRNNRSETLVRDPQTANLKVKTRVRAGLSYSKLEWTYARQK